ncbi:MAG: ATP-binding cassette domain-containing protein [Catonella sp.]
MELKIRNLSKMIDNKHIIDGLNLYLKSGDVLALQGRNGCGKTSLLKIVAGIDKDFDGEVEVDKNLTIGYVPQEIILFEQLSIKDNLKAFCNGENAKVDYQRIELFAEELGIYTLLKKKTGKLSGGQKRLVNFIIGFSNNPNLILLDEVIEGMDKETVGKVIKLINDIKKDKIIIVTSHQEEFINEVCNLWGKMIDGKLELSYEH